MINLLKISAQTNTESNEASLSVQPLRVDRENSLQSYYEAIGCRAIDIVSATINGADVDLIVDDEGLLQQPPEGRDYLEGFLFIDDHGNKIPLAGTVLVAAVDEDGRTTDAPIKKTDVTVWFLTGRAHVINLPPLY